MRPSLEGPFVEANVFLTSQDLPHGKFNALISTCCGIPHVKIIATVH